MPSPLMIQSCPNESYLQTFVSSAVGSSLNLSGKDHHVLLSLSCKCKKSCLLSHHHLYKDIHREANFISSSFLSDTRVILASCHLLMVITPQGVQESSWRSFSLNIDSFHSLKKFLEFISNLNPKNLIDRPCSSPHCKQNNFGKRQKMFAVWDRASLSCKKLISPDESLERKKITFESGKLSFSNWSSSYMN